MELNLLKKIQMPDKRMVYEFFPDEWIQLNAELCSGLHPKLEQILSRINVEDIDMKLAHIASYCEVILDGDYTLEERSKLCEILRKKLIEKRERPDKIIILN